MRLFYSKYEFVCSIDDVTFFFVDLICTVESMYNVIQSTKVFQVVY
jgi:hypothetical protein